MPYRSAIMIYDVSVTTMNFDEHGSNGVLFAVLKQVTTIHRSEKLEPRPKIYYNLLNNKIQKRIEVPSNIRQRMRIKMA